MGARVRSWGVKGHVQNADLPLLELDPSVSGIVLNPGDAKKGRGEAGCWGSPAAPGEMYYAVADRIKFGAG